MIKPTEWRLSPRARKRCSQRWNKVYRKSQKMGQIYAGNLKNHATAEEDKLKATLKSIGVRYEFQKTIPFLESKPYFRIVDFFLQDHLTIIEVDGPEHFTKKGIERDRQRDAQFKCEYPHFRFIRIKNTEVRDQDFALLLRSKIHNEHN